MYDKHKLDLRSYRRTVAKSRWARESVKAARSMRYFHPYTPLTPHDTGTKFAFMLLEDSNTRKRNRNKAFDMRVWSKIRKMRWVL